MSDPRILAATLTLAGIDPIHGKDVIPDERDVKWLLIELDEADKAAGFIRVNTEFAHAAITSVLHNLVAPNGHQSYGAAAEDAATRVLEALKEI